MAPQPVPGAGATTGGFRGEVVYVFAFDVAYDMSRKPVRELLGQPVAQFSVDASRRTPRQLFFHKPWMVRLPPWERIGPRGAVRVERAVKVLPVGAISVTIRVPFSGESLADLVAFHDLRFANSTLHDEVRALAEDVRRELARHYIRPVAELAAEEAYTVFCLETPGGADSGRQFAAESWLEQNRRAVAALLTQEADPEQLSAQEAAESTGRHFSYYEQDLVVVDWDAALIIDEPRHFDETLYVMELANLQLAELEAYDRILDQALERSYRDLSERRARSRAGVLRELRDLRIDLARFNDELSNITKFFGDWHLARLYEGTAARFHLGDWQRSIERKLRTLDDLYQLLKHDQNHLVMLGLELIVVVLFVVDLLILYLGGGH